LDAVRRARIAAPRTPLVVLTGFYDEELAALALQHGAQDYLVKDEIGPRGLHRALRYAIERHAMEEALFVEQEMAQVTLNSIGDGVVSADLAGTITYLNVVAETLAGWSQEEALGRSVGEVFPIVDAVTGEPFRNPMLVQVEQHRFVNLPSNALLVRRDHSTIAVENSTAPIHGRDGHRAGSVMIFRDVTAARAMTKAITYSAHHDFLTDLPNRLLLDDRITQAIAMASRHEHLIAVLFLDLDHFKHINDSLGHPTGDKLLQSVAERLVESVRDSDTVSRQGGDEFLILLPEIEQPEAAAVLARRILESLGRGHQIGPNELHVTASIGISIYPADGDDAEALMKNADTAMYQAKESGRQTYRFFEPAMNIRAVERQFIEESLRRALERAEFEVHYQAKVDLRSDRIIGSEALIRWNHPVRGPIAPLDFIPTAEECGLIVPIGRWVLREACGQAQAWIEAGLLPTTVAVNVSAMEFQDDDFLESVFTILSETGLAPALLELEITESVLMKHAQSTMVTLQSLRSHGVRVSVDDFGTGYSSLSYLQQFPVDSLKIDQSFIRDLSARDQDAALVTAVINMAQSLKLSVVAEGVETVEERDFLVAQNCDEAQGFYYSRPVPPAQFAALLRADEAGRGGAAAAAPASP
jgi:diguanylate cyclase (GGDEF)-like protein/PAS domain S-box-containing protein